ncbi:cation acetate symporter [Streptomyces ovatisporus]|uniref:Cation acetate symporter n=1 Tax=Streptomyces ovatisporus TaxID=1128682 RepID=A0ABV9A903_9ACTN
MTGLVGDRAAAISLFLLFIAGCLFVSMLASPDLQQGGGGFYTHPARSRPLRQGLALTGDFVSAAGVLYFCGIVAVAGYDGVFLIVAAALSPLLLKVWLAERLPGGPGRSLGDVLARRLPSGPARRAAGVATLVVSLPLLVAQLVPIGRITAALMGVPGRTGEITGIVLVGVLICACAGIGGVRGATLLQIGKAVALVVVAPLLAVLVLANFHWDYGELLTRAAQGSGAGDAYLAPGMLFGTGTTDRLDTLSLALTVLLGTAFLPHLLTRLSASPTVNAARRASSWAVLASCLLCATAAVTGYGIQALIDGETLREAGPRGGDNVLLLAAALDGGDPAGKAPPGTLLTFVSCVAFLIVLASAMVLLLAGSAAIVHDLGRDRHALSGHGPVPRRLRARTALLLVGGVCIGLAVTGRTANAQFWLTLSYTEAATVVLPGVAYSLLWRRFTVRGLRWCVHGGTLVTVVLLALSPAVSGSPHALVPDADWSLFPLHAPGLVSIPAAFLLGALGSLRRPDKGTPARPGPQEAEPVNATGTLRP